MRKFTLTLILIPFIFHLSAQNNALNFDGTDDFVSIPHTASLLIGSNPVTLELWFNAANADQQATFIAKRQPSAPFPLIALYTNDGTDPRFTPDPGKKISFAFGNPSPGGVIRIITTVNDILDGAYHHLAGVVNPTTETLSIYVDGALQSVNTITGGSFPSLSITDRYVIGQNNGNNAFFNGLIDEVRIWNVARTQAEIQANRNTELTGNESGLVAYYKMDIPNSTCDAEDCNGNENHGTRMGTGGGNNLPQFSSDIPSITDVACGVSVSCALPVELVSFAGKWINGKNILKWTTASETNNSGFEVHKSKDGINWEAIGFVDGHGTTDVTKVYRFVDNNPLPELNYFRLKQVDFDGHFEFSSVLVIKNTEADFQMEVFPNPTVKEFTLHINNPLEERIDIVVSDKLGRIVWREVGAKSGSTWRKKLQMEQNGLYFIAAQIGDQTINKRVIIQGK